MQHATVVGALLLDPLHEHQLLLQLRMGNSGKGHPNVVRLVDAAHNQDHCWSVFEHAGGGDLFDQVFRTGRLTDSVAAHYFNQIAQGVAYLHAQHVAHLDISLENVLLDSNNVVKISDFGRIIYVLKVSGLNFLIPGMAKKLQFVDSSSGQQLVLLTTSPGKAMYQSPEIVNGTPFDPRHADCWALGIALFIMLTGFPPWQMAAETGSTRLLFAC